MAPVRKVLMAADGRRFFIRDDETDYHCQFGVVKKADLKTEGAVTTSTGKRLTVLKPSFMDVYGKIRRGPQIIPLKDVGSIVASLGLGKTSRVVEAGTGSGALACFLANLVREVVSYELREDFHAIAAGNVKDLGLKNVVLKQGDVRKGIAEKKVDAVLLDMPDPWNAVGAAAKALKPGGFLVSYSPTVPQVMDVVAAIKERFVHVRTVEVLEREWEVEARRTRPKSQQIGHSGFLTFARKV